MLLTQAFLKFSSCGVLIALAFLIIRDGLHVRALQFSLPLIASLICLFLSSGHPDITVTGPMLVPLRLFDMLSFIFVWWFGLALFDDEFRLGPIEWASASVFIAIYLPGRLHYLGFDVWWSKSMDLVTSAIVLALMAHIAYVAIAGHREDLVESRRKMRKSFAIAIVLLIVVTVLMERLAGSFGIAPYASIHTIYLFTLPLSLWAIMWIAVLNPDNLAFPAKELALTENSIDPKDTLSHQRLVSIMEDEAAYAEHGLTIGKLSQKVGIPPHQLRNLINQSMGYRNYTAFLNHYRIEAVKASLSDAQKSRTPVLTLAIEAGFSSLAPFNRAFKDSEGITPTKYRQQQLTKANQSE